MAHRPIARSVARLATAAAAIPAAAYAAYVATAWRGYGAPPPAEPDERNELLDQFMPDYDVVERHRIAINARRRSSSAPRRSRT